MNLMVLEQPPGVPGIIIYISKCFNHCKQNIFFYSNGHSLSLYMSQWMYTVSECINYLDNLYSHYVSWPGTQGMSIVLHQIGKGWQIDFSVLHPHKLV